MVKKKDSMVRPVVERVQTKITGFDDLIKGGFVKNSLNLVSGGPGCGKTTFCLQFIYNGIKEFDENGLVISFDENLSGLKEDSLQYGWCFSELEKEKKCAFLAFDPFQNAAIKEDITNAIKKNKVKRVVIDSMSFFSMAIGEDKYKLRKELYKLTYLLKSLNCTTIVTAEISGEAPLDVTQGGPLSRDGMVEFVADSVTTLHNSGIGGEADRAIRVVKMRRTKHRRDPVPLEITDCGIVVRK
jgi:circadian clock protein KaiC